MDEEAQKGQKSWLRKLSDTLQVVSFLVSAFFLFGVLYLSFLLESRVDPLVDDIGRRVDDVAAQQSDLQQNMERFTNILEKISENSTDAVSGASIAVRLDEIAERVFSLEETLNIQPRQIIELSLLRDEIEDLRQEADGERIQMLREIDRVFNTILMLVGGLIIAIISMAVGNLLRRGG